METHRVDRDVPEADKEKTRRSAQLEKDATADRTHIIMV